MKTGSDPSGKHILINVNKGLLFLNKLKGVFV